ncbi:MAG: hypothetical protein M3Q97_05035 [Bacteroidota bacterium]|nr:hypothetical protein [Bacteroidota bacterium]
MTKKNFLFLPGIFAGFFLLLPDQASAQCAIDSATRIVSQTEHWNADRSIRGNIEIDSNAALHVYGTLSFREDAYIDVKRGGRLYLHAGARLTHECADKMWDGVILNGTSARPQYSSGSYDAGQAVFLMDTAVIEYAQLGIKVQDGAVLKAYSDTFSNCRTGVEFTLYESTVFPATNQGRFENCDFLSTATLPGYNAEGIDVFVKLTGVRGISFFGCVFENRIVTQLDNAESCGKGIESRDASFTLERSGPYGFSELCVTQQALGRRSQFTGLYRAVEHNAIDPKYSVSISECRFINSVETSIYLVGEYGTEIKRCFFSYDIDYLKPISFTLWLNCILLASSKSFNIDSNYFQINSLDTLGYVKMIESHYSGRSGGRIYGNKFSKSFLDTLLVEPIIIDGNSPKILLQCNTFDGFNQDIRVNNNPPYIFQDQGSPTLDAGNVFSTCGMGSVLKAEIPRIHIFLNFLPMVQNCMFMTNIPGFYSMTCR